ncbi:hypothetical protein PR202_gb28575 [Eleusine coracana subsp. coracana]|uniref:Uncharacterized protein n=1 Tax=Eleusine coracana subsp. coracana TaxID=191504 RepID=A0AAV5FX85_ELECO|nr:hypothetical protein QOZ80_8BG0648120 [Eleusine coracana subsp. coracana]GJN39454.1 hypothetical protein PR202_gb28575 [Eleusine coracana subsp. coracana]
MLFHAELHFEVDLHGMAAAAVRRSAGQCEAFWGEYAGDDRFILYLSERAPMLNSLRFISCYDVCEEAFMEAMRKFPLLEELELSISPNVYGEAYGVVGESCPHLKRFRLSKNCFISIEGGGFDKNEEARGIAKMHELRSLQLFNCELTDTGLAAILDGCPHLDSLDIRQCFNVTMDAAAIRTKYATITSLKLPHDGMTPQLAMSFRSIHPNILYEMTDDFRYVVR